MKQLPNQKFQARKKQQTKMDDTCAARSIWVDREREVARMQERQNQIKTHDAILKVRINYPKFLSQDTYPQ